MSLYSSQLKYFTQNKDNFQDSQQKRQFLQFRDKKITIIQRQKAQKAQKYYLSCQYNQTITHIKFKILQENIKTTVNFQRYVVIAEFQPKFFKNYIKNLFDIIKITQIVQVIESVSNFIPSCFKLQLKNTQQAQKKIVFIYKSNELNRGFQENIIKMMFFMFQLVVDRLKLLGSIKNKKLNQEYKSIASFRKKIFYQQQRPYYNQSKQQFQSMIKQQQLKGKQSLICSFENINNRNLKSNQKYIQHQEQQKRLQKFQQKIQNKKKYIFDQNQKKKVFTNIQVINIKAIGKFYQSKYSVLTKCILQYKDLITHHNRRHNYQNCKQSQNYFADNFQNNKKLSTFQNSFMKKQPLIIAQTNNSLSNKDKNRSQIAKKIFNNQKNTLQIMMELQSCNIAQFFVNARQEYALYSKLQEHSLHSWLKKRQNNILNLNVVLDILIQLLNGLKQLSYFKLIHRDLKPQNIIIQQNRKTNKVSVKIIDFGSAIYSYQDKIDYKIKVVDKFFPELRSTQGYYMDFTQATILDAELQKKHGYTEVTYNRHQKFDIYSVGIILKLLKKKVNCSKEVHKNMQYLIKRCLQLNPDLRISIRQAISFLVGLYNSTI